MRLLALDTATHHQSLAVCVGDRLVERGFPVRRGHTASLLRTIDGALEEAGVTPHELELVVIGTGPGSFTGLRIGLSAVRALSFAVGCPLVGVGTLRTLAQEAAQDQSDQVVLAPTLDARKREVYGALYGYRPGETLTTLLPPCNASPNAWLARLEEYEKVVVTGNGIRVMPELAGPTVLEESRWWPRASILAKLGERRYVEEGAPDLRTIEPQYIRLSDAELNWSKKRATGGTREESR